MPTTPQRVNPVETHLEFEDIDQIPESKWYKYTLACGHEVYTRVRIAVPKHYSYFEHYILCPVEKHHPLQWQGIAKMESVTDEHMSNVRSGTSFVLPRRILRVPGHKRQRDGNDSAIPSGNPFPYSSGSREY